jgi:DNA-binding response OmpR family regulator
MAKILVADDDRDFVKLLKAHLESSGYQTLFAYDGQEALDKILRAVAEKDPSLRHVAVLALAAYGPRARPALPALL